MCVRACVRLCVRAWVRAQKRHLVTLSIDHTHMLAVGLVEHIHILPTATRTPVSPLPPFPRTGSPARQPSAHLAPHQQPPHCHSHAALAHAPRKGGRRRSGRAAHRARLVAHRCGEACMSCDVGEQGGWTHQSMEDMTEQGGHGRTVTRAGGEACARL